MREAARGVFCLGLAMITVAAVGCRRYPPPTPLTELNPKQRAGHGVFQVRCGQCHYDRQDGALHGPSLVSLNKKPSLPSGAPANDERVTATVLYGRNMMPPMGDALGPGDLDDLLAYLHTL